MSTPFPYAASLAQLVSSNPSVMGTYADPSQLGQDVASSNDYTFGSATPDLKAQAAAQKAQTAAYNPYLRSLISSGNQRPQLDTSASADWGAGLAKGLSNVYGIQQYSHHQHQDEQALQQYQNMLQSQQVAQQHQADLLVQSQQANTQHILQKYGPDAAFAYQLNPGEYGKAQATNFGALPTVQPEAHDKALGGKLGEGEGHLDNVVSDETFLKQNGAPLSDANKGQMLPGQRTLRQEVTGQPGEDQIDAQKRWDEGQITKGEAGAAGYRPGQASATLAGTQIDNVKKQLEADRMSLQAKFDPDNMANDAELKTLSVEEKTKMLHQRDQAMQMMEAVDQQLAQGKALNPNDAIRLDTLMKGLGSPTNYVGSLKEIANPKAGQALKADTVKNATGANGYVTLPSGIQINPGTGHVIHPGQARATAARPDEQSARFKGTSIGGINHPAAPWQNLGDLLGRMVHGGGSIINPTAETIFNGGY